MSVCDADIVRFCKHIAINILIIKQPWIEVGTMAHNFAFLHCDRKNTLVWKCSNSGSTLIVAELFILNLVSNYVEKMLQINM